MDIPLALENPEQLEMGPLLRVGSLFPVNGLDLTSVEEFISLKIVEPSPLRKEGSDAVVNPVVTVPLERKFVP